MMARNRRKARVGYASGGTVDNQYANASGDDAVKPDTTAEWTPEAYQASLRQQEAQGYAGGGAVRQNFRRGGTAFRDDAEARERMAEQERMQQQADQAEQARYDAMSPRDKQIYAANNPDPSNVSRGYNAALGGAANMALLGTPHGIYGSYGGADINAALGAGSNPIAGAGYAGGGAVRRIGYADGGRVYDDPSGTVMPDYRSPAAAEEIEQVRAETAAREQVAAERQRRVEPAQPGPQAPEQSSASQVVHQPSEPGDQRSLLSRFADYMHSTFMSSAQAAQPAGGAGSEVVTPPTPAAAPPAAPDVLDRITQGGVTGYIKGLGYKPSEGWDTSKPLPSDASFGDITARTLAKGAEGFAAPAKVDPYSSANSPYDPQRYGATSGKDQLLEWLNGKQSYSSDELSRLVEAHPTGDWNKALQADFNKKVVAGDNEGALQTLQTSRKPYDAAHGFSVAAADAGNLKASVEAHIAQYNTLPNGRAMTAEMTKDGTGVTLITKPEAGQPGTEHRYPMNTQQYYNWLHSPGSQFDHAAKGDFDNNLNAFVNPQRALNVPNEGERMGQSGMYNQFRENVLNTEGGFHPDSPMGLMDRAAQAAKFNRPDREATEYADRARAAVANGVPADQVHQYLRTGGDQRPGTSGVTDFSSRARGAGGAAPPEAVTVGPDGRPVYAPQTNIPGAGSPDAAAQLHADEIRTGMKSVTDPGGRDLVEEHRKQSSSSDKGGSSQSSESGERYQVRPPSYFEDPKSTAQPFVGYNYGERRAGSYAAPTNQQDYQPISRVQGPPVPPGFTPPPPGAEAQVQVMRSPTTAGYPAAPRDYNREDALRYNAQLAGRQNQIRGPDDLAYQERGRQAVEKMAPGYAAAQNAARDAQTQRITELNAAERARSAEAMRADTDPITGARKTTNQLAQELALAESEGRRLAPTQMRTQSAERIADVKTAGILTRTEKEQAGRNIRFTEGEAGKDRRLDTTEAGKGARQEQREGGKWDRMEYTQDQLNQRADNVNRYKDQHLDFLRSNAAAQIEQRYATDDSRQVMNTLRSKLNQGDKPDENEMDVYQQLLDRAHAAGVRTPNTNPEASTVFPVLDFARRPENRTDARGGTPMADPNVIQPAAIEMLRKNPHTATQFDAKYGAGMAQQILNRPS